MEKKTEKLEHIRHSTAHLLAASVLDLYPEAKNAIGPAIENGFYQDFDFGDVKITDEDLPKIEKHMRQMLKTWDTFAINEVTIEQAKKDFAWNPYKSELIEEFAKEGKTITETKQGKFLDLCKGGHSENPGKDIGAFTLLSLAGAYWRGSEKNKMLTRIYGTAFASQKELDDYLLMLEEAKRRDHKKLGRELDLFFFDETSPGMAYWLPKGLVLYNTLYSFAREMYVKHGYQEVATPQLNKKGLYETSGHWQHYREDMFISPMSFLREESREPFEGTEVFGIKPMNCPNAMRIFRSKTRSYNDLPMRYGETSTLHRFELSGTLNGLFRTRMFRQDDAHIFLQVSQVKEEFGRLMRMVEEMYEPFNLTYRFRYGTRPENFLGDGKDWDVAESSLKTVLDESGKEYFEAAGEGAFYGPKVDILMKDSLGREWQTGTIQLDFQQPKNFELKYTDTDGTEKMPVVFHRAILGSLERFLGVITENYAGAFPAWLSPVQLMLLPVADRHNEYGEKILTELKTAGIRTELDIRAERLQAKIRSATLQKIPYMGIIGDKEMQSDKLMLSVRSRSGDDIGQLDLLDFIHKVREEIDKKK